jgi:hypothetical protein
MTIMSDKIQIFNVLVACLTFRFEENHMITHHKVAMTFADNVVAHRDPGDIMPSTLTDTMELIVRVIVYLS